MKMHLALRSAALVALMAPLPAAAGVIVDTGTPAGGIIWTLAPIQSLAGHFNVATGTTITQIEGFFWGSGTVTATLYSDGSVPDASNALFSTTFSSLTSDAWAGASGLNWTVGAGNYWLGFDSNNDMGMRNGAPSPVDAYAYTAQGNWNRFDDLDIGIRVFDGAIPEPGTWALLLLGFGAIGAGMRAHKRPQVTVRFAA